MNCVHNVSASASSKNEDLCLGDHASKQTLSETYDFKKLNVYHFLAHRQWDIVLPSYLSDIRSDHIMRHEREIETRKESEICRNSSASK